MEIMRAREANGLPVISPMLGLPPEKWECEFRDYLVALGDPRVADPEWLAARIRRERRAVARHAGLQAPPDESGGANGASKGSPEPATPGSAAGCPTRLALSDVSRGSDNLRCIGRVPRGEVSNVRTGR
jgi:hypothetical protein